MNMYINTKQNNNTYCVLIGNDYFINSDQNGKMNNIKSYQTEMRHTMSYREKRHSSIARERLEKYNNNQLMYDTIDVNKTIKQSNNHMKGPYSQNNNYPVKNNNYISSKQLIPSTNVYKLSVPKPNSLTDQFMQKVLGSQQILMQQYDRTVNPQKYQQQRKQQMIQSIKKQWMKSNTTQFNQYNRSNLYSQNGSNIYQLSSSDKNSYVDNNFICANQSKAFHDQNYYTYLKTNMKYLVQLDTQKLKPTLNSKNVTYNPKDNPKQPNSLINQFNTSITKPQAFINGQGYHLINDLNQISTQDPDFNDNYSTQQNDNTGFLPCDPNTIINKLKQTGGIQNTIKKMQKSLKKNQLKHLRENLYLQPNKNNKLTLSSESPKIQTTNNKSQLTPNKIQIKNKNTQENFGQVKSVNNSFISFMNKNHQQPRKINHNYNQSLQNTNKNISQLKINNNLQYQPRNKSNWRQKSQSMRNKINQSLQKK